MNARCRLIPFAAQRVVPWVNGGGSTREVAVEPDGASIATGCRWRVSRATVAADGPFSVLPGVDRSLWLLRGDGMVLAMAEQTLVLDRPGQRFDFAGETTIHATLLGGACEDLNVMTARGHVVVHAELLELAAGERLVLPAAPQHLLLALEGGFDVQPHAIAGNDGDAVRADDAGVLTLAATRACVLLATRFAPRV